MQRPKSQIEAYDTTAAHRMTQRDLVLMIVRESRHRPLTLAEITARYNETNGTRTPESTISGRLNELRDQGEIVTTADRECSVSRRVKQTWKIAPSLPVQLTLGRAS